MNRKRFLQASLVVLWFGGAIVTLLVADDKEPATASASDAGNPIVGECKGAYFHYPKTVVVTLNVRSPGDGSNGWWSPGLRDRMRPAEREYNEQLDSTLNGGGG